MTRSTSGEWVLSPSNELTSADLTRGIEALNRELKGGPTERIAQALMVLIAVTRRPSSMDDDRAKLYFGVIQQAMMDYPVDIVEEGLAQWRKGPQGEWWPAEAELRRVCEKLFEPRRALRNKAIALLERIEDEEARAAKPSPFAGGRQQRFREEMRKRLTLARFDAYFHYAYLMFQGEDAIVVSNLAAERVLTTEGGDLLKQLGLRVILDPKPFVKVRRPTWEDDTPEEHAEVSRKFNRLKQAMAKGENLAKLRASGEI